jgi:hypothetical protein
VRLYSVTNGGRYDEVGTRLSRDMEGRLFASDLSERQEEQKPTQRQCGACELSPVGKYGWIE